MANEKQVVPRLSRMDFFRLRGAEFFEALHRCIDRELGEGRRRSSRWNRLELLQQGAYAWCRFEGDVLNGGLSQFFYNHTDAFVPALEALLKASGSPALVPLLRQAAELYREHRNEFRVENPFGSDGLFARMTELAKLDRPVCRQFGRTDKQLEKWLRSNISPIAVGDTGEPIDPTFSGEIVTHHPNGNVFERGSIRRGVFGGAYHRYLEDGALDSTTFYQGGKISTDYWPNGQPRHKTMKRGPLKIDEWYHPSGNIQKRFVADKTGYAVEPVRLWHDNGLLAEEVYVQGGKKFGPWLKFFENGSPRIQAEHRKGETRVVENAWDDQRQQTVKDGSGIYFDDGIEIDVQYKLFFESSWTTSQELHDGIPNGAGTTWNQGGLWSEQESANGKYHGVYTLFYKNGRVRERSTYRKGKEIETEKFPKFDDPRPAVLLRVSADAELYEAWGHPLLDEYPTPRNLEQMQGRLEVPPFLIAVFERNSSGEVKQDYDNINTFDDYVAYMVMVNEGGVVDDVQFSGASAYSGGTINVYPPIIRELEFSPGRIRGRAVRCRVVVWVHHTFEEADPEE